MDRYEFKIAENGTGDWVEEVETPNGFWVSYEEAESTITHLEAQQKYDLDKLAKAEKRLEELEKWAEDSQKWMLEAQVVMSDYDVDGEILIKLIARVYNLLRGE